MAKLTPQDNKKIRKFRRFFPKKIGLQVLISDEGGYCAKIITFPGCVTQAETFSELIEMVNDAVATVLEVPRKYLSYMPTYLPPLSLAQQLNVFPSRRTIDKPITFSIP